MDKKLSPISGTMTVTQTLALLSSGGCKNVTRQIDLRRTGTAPISTGGQGNIHKGKLTDGTQVAIKVIRIAVPSNSSDERKLKNAAHELYIWTKCKHRNILELIGMANFYGSLAMVSPWVGNNNLSWFLSHNPQVDRYKICTQVAEGLAYLHLVPIVHGDIKCGNILISQDHVPKLIDFGNSILKREYTMKFKASSEQPVFSLRWAAPELLPSDDEMEAELTFKSDIYALGMTLLEIMSGNVPYSGFQRETSVMAQIVQHRLPKRPEHCMIPGDAHADKLWDLIETTWAKEPGDRPEAHEVIKRLNAIGPRDLSPQGAEPKSTAPALPPASRIRKRTVPLLGTGNKPTIWVARNRKVNRQERDLLLNSTLIEVSSIEDDTDSPTPCLSSTTDPLASPKNVQPQPQTYGQRRDTEFEKSKEKIWSQIKKWFPPNSLSRRPPKYNYSTRSASHAARPGGFQEPQKIQLLSLAIQCTLTLSEVTKELAPIPAIGPLVGCLTGVFQAVGSSKVNKDQWTLLRGRCVMILRIAGAHVENYGKEHFNGLPEAAAMLQEALVRVEERARHYNEMDELVALVLYQTISDEIQALFADLDTCLKLFNFSMEAAQEQWTGEYEAVQKREARELQQLRGELEKMNVSFDAFKQNQDQLLDTTNQMLVALKQVLDDKSRILQDQTTTTVASYVDAQQIVRTILSVTKLHFPPKLLLGEQCTPIHGRPVKSGVTCDILQKFFLGGEKVAKKVFRITKSHKEYVENYTTRILQMASLWYGFRSDYTLRFYGIGMELFDKDVGFHLYMLSPWMKNSDAITFLKQRRNNRGMKKNMLRIITDAAMGLQCLHNQHPPVVHCGMRGDNIMITDTQCGVLGGFGLTKTLESLANDKALPADMTWETECQRWMAPEMFVDHHPRGTPCDIWGWAMTALEVISGLIPYHMYKRVMTIIVQISKGPPRREHHPKWEEYAYRPDEMWDLLEECWAMEPQNRPNIDEVVERLKQIAKMSEADGALL